MKTKAFPSPNTHPSYNHGMDLRDWFAGQNFAATMTNANGLGGIPDEERLELLYLCAKLSYEGADAMMKAREAQ